MSKQLVSDVPFAVLNDSLARRFEETLGQTVYCAWLRLKALRSTD
jgi:hypothetical protein